jgi:ring-1,2-phenylacetyl-CoA epoxidase subunit PaaE
MNTLSLTISEIRKETIDSVTLFFKQPLFKKIKYQPGQYLVLVFRINGRMYRRAYSLSSTPNIDAGLEVTVKRIKGGVVSNFINDQITVGDIIEAYPPMGDFILTEKNKSPIFFLWGVGSGITPLFSILKSILNDYPEKKVILVYGNKNIESTIFWKQLSDLEVKFQSKFKVWHFHTEAVNTEKIFKGRIQADIVLSNFDVATIESSSHFICGPSDFKGAIIQNLSTYSLKSNSILFENFRLQIGDEELQSLEDRVVAIKINSHQKIIKVQKGKTVLECALNCGLEIPYSCQTGSCNTCMALLKSGKLKMIGLSEDRTDLAENEFLLCCSYPLSDNILIEL